MNAIWNLEKTKKGARAKCFTRHPLWAADELNDLKSRYDGCEVGQNYYVYTRNGKLILEKTDEILEGNGFGLYQTGNMIEKTFSVGTMKIKRILVNERVISIYFEKI